MLQFHVRAPKPKDLKDECLIIGTFEDEFPKGKKARPTSELLKHFDGASGRELTAQALRENFSAKLASINVYNFPTGSKGPSKIILLGLGDRKKLINLNDVRKATAAAIRLANGFKKSSVGFGIFEYFGKETMPELAAAIVEVCTLATYKFDKYLNKKDDDTDEFKGIKDISIVLDFADAKMIDAVETEVEYSCILTEGVLLARDLICEPPNVANPAHLAKVAIEKVKAQKSSNLTLKVLEETDCRKLKMDAFLAVAQGSDNPPKLLHFHYKPKGKPKKHIAIVGKGVTFDSGGLSLKPAKAMEKMKYDMSGAAAVIGLMSVITDLKPNVEVTAIVAACENMPSGKAYRPGDVLRAMNGKTIEVNNTDAEGRLTLADAVHYALLQKPDELLDIATLTGAVVVALGETAAGMMTNDQELLDRVKIAFEGAGERVWQLPMFDDYEEDVVKCAVADMINAGSGGQAGSQNGAMFIKQFVGDTPWVHLDIAGTCWPERRDTHFTPRNSPAGFGVLGFARYLRSF